jgi:endonuclease YncB( thermonuclease family)
MVGRAAVRAGGGWGPVAIAALVGLFPASATAAPPDRFGCALAVTRTVAAVAVIDGDTVKTDQGLLRLAGIEAPKPDGFGGRELAGTAAAALERRVVGQTLQLAEVGSGPDRYGRVHAQVFLGDGTWLQAELVGVGLARVRPLVGEEACVSGLLAAESAARSAARGIWADGQYRPRDANDPSLSQQNGIYEIVEGRVLSVGHGSYMAFLDFGPDYRRDFSVMIPPSVAKSLAEAGLPVDAFKGRLLRVRGVIEESGGPAIRVYHPTAIEVLDGR